MNKMEKTMLDVMAELTLAHAPIAFKGAMLLKVAIEESSPISVVRETRDLDGDWLQKSVSMEQMKNIVEKAVQSVNPDLSVCVFREFAENKSAGFWILNRDQERLFSIDLGIRPHPFQQNYQISYQGKPLFIRGATLPKMLADKICAISSPKVFRRAKDLVDVYILSHCKGFDLLDVHRLTHANGRTPGTFEEFCSRKDDLKHAYEKLANVENKPDFQSLYDRVNLFLKPFIRKELRSREWTGEAWKEKQYTSERGQGR